MRRENRTAIWEVMFAALKLSVSIILAAHAAHRYGENLVSVLVSVRVGIPCAFMCYVAFQRRNLLILLDGAPRCVSVRELR